ncbi:FAD:protein FMN transferase [Paraliobacillus ryukyuensis]|uniref:FAD:protein FMN transferase n=1 Tax=Paraliobacillus ryukyuensis TaxID=200904 RepID=UPI0009A6C640|nr:FAD:protein FMN transferase [Paraliobacillus ryukyuensis]
MPRSETSVHMMGTIIDLMIDSDESKQLINQVIDDLKVYDKRFSANQLQSELMAVNQQAGITPISVHPELFHLIKLGKLHSTAENSFLNIALGPLIKMWHIGFNDARKPTDYQINTVLKLTDPNQIQLHDENRTVFLPQKGMEIDLGALAKGFIADQVIQKLRQHKVKTAYINLGGNFLSTGLSSTRKSGEYRIGIQDPKKERHHYLLAVDTLNQSVVTSGVYERKLKHDSKSFHHIFDPKTGYPIKTDVASLTIVSSASIDGEIWTTRLFGYPAEEIVSIVNTLTNIESIVITNDSTIYISKGLKGKITPFTSTLKIMD